MNLPAPAPHGSHDGPPSLKAAVVYYGTSPSQAALGPIEAPVLGLYGGDDARVNQTIAPAAQEMKRLGRR